MTIRQRGMILMTLGGATFALFAYWIAAPGAYPLDSYPAGPGGALLIAAPGVAALIGLIETTTGIPFHQLEEAWAELNGWQRFLGGTLFVIVGGAIVFAGVAAALL